MNANSPASFRIGIIGAGRWGMNIIRTLQDFPEVELVWVARRSGKNLSPPFDQITVVADWRAAVEKKPPIDAVIAAVPPHMHIEIAANVARQGMALWLEKPLAITIQDAEAIRDAFANDIDKLFVDHTYLFNPAFIELKRLVDLSGRIRRINLTAGNWGPFRTSIPVLWDWAPHDAAMVLRLKSEMPQHLGVATLKQQTINGGEGEHIWLHGIFGDGVEWYSEISNIRQDRIRNVEVECSDTSYTFEDNHGSRVWERTKIGKKLIFETHAKPLNLGVERFLRMLGTGIDADSTAVAGLNVVRLLSNLNCKTDVTSGLSSFRS